MSNYPVTGEFAPIWKMRVICQNIIIHVSIRIVLYNPENQTLYSFLLLFYPYCKEIHNQGLMWGLDYVFPFFFKEIIWVKSLLWWSSYIREFILAQWLGGYGWIFSLEKSRFNSQYLGGNEIDFYLMTIWYHIVSYHEVRGSIPI